LRMVTGGLRRINVNVCGIGADCCGRWSMVRHTVRLISLYCRVDEIHDQTKHYHTHNNRTNDHLGGEAAHTALKSFALETFGGFWVCSTSQAAKVLDREG
jgi:hypothetical protein